MLFTCAVSFTFLLASVWGRASLSGGTLGQAEGFAQGVADPCFPSSTWTKIFLSIWQRLPMPGGIVQTAECWAGARDTGKLGANKGASGEVPVCMQGNLDLP